MYKKNIVTSCESALGKGDILLFCEKCDAGFYRSNNTECVSSCPDTSTPLSSGICGDLSTGDDGLNPCNATTECINPLKYCNPDSLTCLGCNDNTDCDGHVGYGLCLAAVCRGTRNFTVYFNTTSLTIVLTPTEPFILINPPISSIMNVTDNGQNYTPSAINNTDDYSQITVHLNRATLNLGTNNVIVTFADLTSSLTEAVILDTTPLSISWFKPKNITYSIVQSEYPQVFQITFSNYSFDTVSDLRKYLNFNFSGYITIALAYNDTILDLIEPSILQVTLNKTVNESIYSQQLIVDMATWNAVNGTTDPAFIPDSETVDVDVTDTGYKIFLVSRTAQISAIGTAAFCFLVDLSTSCSRSSYVRFYAMTERISILRYVNIEYHPITVGFFQEMDLDLSSMPYFFSILANTSSLHPERNITILNEQNYIGYLNIFLQSYGGTALLQGLIVFVGVVLVIIDWIIDRRLKRKKKVPALFAETNLKNEENYCL